MVRIAAFDSQQRRQVIPPRVRTSRHEDSSRLEFSGSLPSQTFGIMKMLQNGQGADHVEVPVGDLFGELTDVSLQEARIRWQFLSPGQERGRGFDSDELPTSTQKSTHLEKRSALGASQVEHAIIALEWDVALDHLVGDARSSLEAKVDGGAIGSPFCIRGVHDSVASAHVTSRPVLDPRSKRRYCEQRMGRNVSQEQPVAPRPPRLPPPRLSLLRILLGLAVAGFVIWMLVRFVGGVGELRVTRERLQLGYLPLALLSSTFGIYIAANRMRLALLLTGDRVTRWEAARAVLSAWPISVLSPARVGDFLRAVFLTPRIPLARGLGAIFAEKIVDVFVLVGLGSALATILGLEWLGALGLCGLIIGLALLRARGWRGRLRSLPFGRRLPERVFELGAAATQMGKRPRLVLALGTWSVLAVTNGALLIHLLLRLVGERLDFVAVAIRWPVAMLAGGVPVTPAGMATRDAAFVFLLEPEQRTGGVVLATLLYSLTSGWIYALVGLPLFLRTQLRSPVRSAKLDS